VSRGGTVRYTFAKPGGGRLGPGARVGPERMILSVGKNGLEATESNVGAGRAVADPICPTDEVWNKAVAAGVPARGSINMRYAMSDKHDRSVWTVSSTDDPKLVRTLDGTSCNVLVR